MDKNLSKLRLEALKHATKSDFKIWAKERPCSYFLGEDISDEKKKEIWLEVVSDDPKVQAWINNEIYYSRTIPYKIYMELISNPKLIL